MIARKEALLKLDHIECIFNNKKSYIIGVDSEQLINEIFDCFEKNNFCNGCKYNVNNIGEDVSLICLKCKRYYLDQYEENV